MMRMTHIAAVLIAVCLSGCSSYVFDSDTTASFNGTGKSAEWTRSAEKAPEPPAPVLDRPALARAPTNSLFVRAGEAQPDTKPNDTIAALLTDNRAGETARPAEPPPPTAEKVAIDPHGRAYLFRGVAGLIYSRGMDRLASQINRTGVKASVDSYVMWRIIADAAIRDYRRDPAPITIIGHSAGGDSAVAFAETLNEADIPVSLLVTYDPTRMSGDVPPNVERYINLFQSYNVMGGGNVVQGARFHGHYASYDLRNHSEIIHINIEKTERIQDQLVTKIAQLAATPASAEGEALPLRYAVPANAAIELWDSGMPVVAHAGDTLQTIAETYHVPLWSLDQINRVSDHTPLTAGQRIVVPRHLVPMSSPVASALSSYAPTAH